MTILLSDYETGAKYGGDYADDLAALEDRIERLQAAHITHGQRSIIMFEGWDAAGKGGIIQRLTASLDPRYFEVWPIAAPNEEEKARHFLWRFWKRLPGNREISIFDRSWYGRVLVERVEGYASEAEWRKGYDEINEFEAQLTGSRTNLVKLFVHITQKEQDERFADRLSNPWKRWKTGPDDYRNRSKRKEYLAAIEEMFQQTDTRWAPWKVIDGNNKKAARIAALTHIVETLEAAVPMTPPDLDPAVVKLAQKAFGFSPKD
ncbi:polyphosphate kinase [Sphingopyxis sp. H050]|jgi:AMP-polyphosphate phosphotransferase|uniref:polyphosphate kinase 2 family protein n=1 Tax=Sphingopyxis sp. H050 TaxID=1759072 RepID=UPI0007369C12|nr:polyphosphate kinase [Sphingopyxis sp. H050]KTE20218.1 polyphosphate kinase [Sphingopyxis sp. H050]